MIPGSKEFFIAAIDHKEWGTAHTVWGVVSVFCIWMSGIMKCTCKEAFRPPTQVIKHTALLPFLSQLFLLGSIWHASAVI